MEESRRNERERGAADLGGKVLIMTAVDVERDAVLRGLGGERAGFDVLLAGVGPASAAARTSMALAGGRYRLVVSAGIGGGFTGKAEIGSLVVAKTIVAADLGAETPDGFLRVDELGFGSSVERVDGAAAMKLTEALRQAGLPAQLGAVLTVSAATGTAETAADRAERIPDAAAEAMEGYGVAVAASLAGLPVLELRAISNAVGPRDRGAWKIKEALDALEAAGKVLAEVFK
ncbi:futalosine hydrolase [Paenibacillus chartarius]|uniref:Futalosine hydrolase n=1 Tax=Paenibacillus chartarius TaxID=747481 RepID=A0ABV6DFF9_9BACL